VTIHARRSAHGAIVTDAGPRDTAPLSREQQQLWLLQQLAPEAPPSAECVAVTLRGELDIGALRESMAAFTGRHEIWRTTFPRFDGEPVQMVQAEGRLAWSVVDLTGLAEAERQQEALRRAAVEARHPFDLADGPLVRALLVRLAEREHRLFTAAHHMVCDRESLTHIFLPELAELYQARVQGRPPRLSHVDLQYRDYAASQRRRPPSEQESQLVFWKQYLAGAPTVLELPADHPRPEQRTYQTATLPFALGQELNAGLRELSQREHVPLHVPLAAAFGTLLHRYTGQEDLLLGMAVSGRKGQRLRHTAGCFVNTVVLRVDMAGQPSVRELMHRIGRSAEAVRQHEDVPFDAILQAATPERSPGHQPLVQVLLALEPQPPSLVGEWQLAPVPVMAQASAFDLCLELAERADGLSGRFTYNSDLFSEETIRRMIGHWRMLLTGMFSQPRRPLAHLDLLAAPERDRLLRNGSAVPELSEGPDITELIAKRARAMPDAVAVVCEGEQMTYRHLTTRANQVARYLRARGVRAGVPVGVCLERSVYQIVALLAILQAGGIYVPLDPEAPRARLQHVVADTGAPLLLTQQRLLRKIGNPGAALVSLDRSWELIGQQSQTELDDRPRPEELAYILYTSGSTGQPKGVMVERGTLSAHCRVVTDEYQLGPQDRVLQFTPYSADPSLEQILPTLAVGAQLIKRGTEIWSPQRLLAEMKRHQVTVMNLVPTYWQQAVREWARDPEELTGTALRLVILGGERLGLATVQQWRELGVPGVRLLNAYGPTEATITATLGEAGNGQAPVTIGRPLAGRSVYILDSAGRPVPAGVVGELYIGGPLLARGYLNRPDLTDERFIPDPFGSRPGGRLYRTGDLARYLADGRIDYGGRADMQVKIRGYRIELGEIETVLAGHPAVDEAVVVARGEDDGKELVAYVVARGVEPLAQELWRYLGEKLPQYMQPAVIQEVADLPRLATGKPDRRRLPEVDMAARSSPVGYVAPRLLIHQQLVEMWEQLLQPRPIGIRDNFFHSGGNSLLAAKLVVRIERAYGKRLPLSTLFAGPTVEQLAGALQGTPEGTGARAHAGVLPVEAGGSRRPFFFLHGDWSGGAFYCFALARALGADQPFYVLEPYSFSAGEGALPFETIAAAHIEAMQAVQQRGPYRLGGRCNGALLAYEMARQLEANGDQVEFLALVNPAAPFQSSLSRTACELLSGAARADSERRADLYLRVRHAQRHMYRMLRPHGQRLSDFQKLLVIEPRLKAMFPPREALYEDYVGVFNWSAAGYHTGSYGGKVTYYWAREEPAIARRWRPIMRRQRPADVAEHVVAGNHTTCLTEHIQGTTRILAASLHQMEQTADAPTERGQQ
jgi:amino acid adenylation domain-containing protein